MKKKPSLTIVPDPGIIEVRGARQNNLKGFDLDVPLGKLTVVSGPSGSGKSSLAFDTIYAEGQRRYVETFSPYTRQFLERMDKPKVDEIRGIPPAIAIEQSNPVKTTRSTVGTITEINDYLKVLLPRVVTGHCPSCQREIRPETARSIVEEIFALHAGTNVTITFGVPVPTKTDPADFFAFLQQQGYLRVLLEGRPVRVDEPLSSKTRLPAVVPVIQDRTAVSEENRSRLTEAIETGLRFGKGRVAIHPPSSIAPQPFSTGWHCAHCDLDITPPSSGLFSFNHPVGACPKCRGFGRTIAIDLSRALPDRSLSIAGGVVKPFQTENGRECQRDLLRTAAVREVDVNTPFAELPAADQDWVIFGERPGQSGEELWENGLWYGVKGFFDWLESKSYKMHVRVLLSRYRTYTTCPDCAGGRYQPATLNFKYLGRTLPEIMGLAVGDLCEALAEAGHPERSATQARAVEGPGSNGFDRSRKGKRQPKRTAKVHGQAGNAKQQSDGFSNQDRRTSIEPGRSTPLRSAHDDTLEGEIISRLRYLVEVGLGYLSLDRPTRTLSGGEIERVNLTTCLGASLVNTLFVLDEPSIGLHPRDTGRLIRVMKDLRDKGNTLLVVEHEEAVIRAADHLIELGPGRGEAGGDLVFAGPIHKLRRTLTADYLSGKMSVPVPVRRRKPKQWLRVECAAEHNLRGIDVDFPLGVFGCITGVSGSGKSTLVHQVLFENLLRLKNLGSEETAGKCGALLGAERIEEVVMVDQSPLSRTPRSTPAVYLGVFDGIREMFAATEEARSRGLTPGSFSFNSGQGRCPRCGGNGFEKIEMQFLSDVFVRCPECEGRRYQPHILAITVGGKSIYEVLSLTVSEAIRFLDALGFEKIAAPLGVLEEVGLGYLTLGQPLNVLSGGESQRLKLVERLTKRTARNCLLIFDEPTTGLHFDDVALLVKVLDRLVEQGNSLLVIEHNLEVIKCADYVIDLGPEAGAAGGLVIATGTPEAVARVPESHTGRFLRSMLAPRSRDEAEEEFSARVAEESPFAVPRSPVTSANAITVTGAREHNLKNISLQIPREQMVVITGLSGSGKSTLAFDILFAEGQRRFLDSMSAYARQFVEQLEKPDVDLISGLPPSVAIEQRITRGGGKSTVATVTEIYHFLRLLFAKVGTQFCPKCDLPVEKQSLAVIVKTASALAKRGRIQVLAPVVKARKGFHTEVAKWAERHGFAELLVDGEIVRANAFPKLERFREHSIDVVVGAERDPARLQPLVERAIEIGKGTAKLQPARGTMQVVSTEMSCPGCGDSFEELDPRLFSFNSPHGWCPECHGFGEVWKARVDPRLESELEIELDRERQHEWLDADEAQPCPTCAGGRINAIARHVRLQKRSIAEIARLTAREAGAWLKTLRFSGNQKIIAQDILPEIEQRLIFLGKVGLDYLALHRSAKTLSGGESQRIRLAAQLGSNLRGVLYVLDEPTIGLHARDNERLLETLEALKRKGNSLLIVEHDEDTMRRADAIIDLGPGAGRFGGEMVAFGSLKEIARHKLSATGRCLREPLRHPTIGARRPINTVTRWIELRGATANNLKSIDVKFPVGRFTVVTGVSGSGKSSLMRGVLKPAMEAALSRSRKKMTDVRLKGAEHIEAVYEVDQSPIGKTSRSIPATYLGVFDEIRKVFAQVPLARMRGYSASRFSFNTEGGRCETCAGQGVIKVEMNFLPTSYIPCRDCGGQRYNPPTLEVLYNERSIGDVMEMSLDQAASFFSALPKIHRSLQLLCDTGLGYLQLGQASPTLSGGEAQRLKLVSELTRGLGRAQHARLRQQREPKSTLYLLEEPTIGLHMADVSLLLSVLHRLVEGGHTVIVIEHNLSLIADADYVIDLGPEAGDQGGAVVVAGTPEEVARCKTSRTAPFLKRTLKIK